MNFYSIKRLFGALALAGMTIPAVGAEPSGWYVGGSGGQSRAKIDESDITLDLLSSGFTTTRFDDDDRDFAYKLFAGYQFSPNFSIEGGYFDLGEFDYTATTTPEGTLDGKLKFEGYHVDLLGMLPVADQLSLFARMGVHRSRAKASFIGSGAVNVLDPGARETSTDYKVGVGAQYEVTPHLALRVEVERFRMDDAVGNKGDLDLLSAGAVFRFGGRAPAPVARVEAPVERPRPVAPAPVQPREEYCSLLDIQFEIAQDGIQLADQERLAVVSRFLKLYPNTSAVIEGHTDDVGSAESNMILSQSRAESVVDHLVNEAGIARSRLKAVGYGETRPIADNMTEAGKRANRRIATVIDCATDIAGLKPVPARTTVAMSIPFDTDTTIVDPRYRNVLGGVAELLKADSSVTATLEGHTDDANPEQADQVSRARAQSVADYLVKEFGIDRSRLRVEGFGGTRRMGYDSSAEGRQQNRRVDVILSYAE